MADTLLTVAQRVARRVGIDPNFTSFSDDDETQLLVDAINEGVSELWDRLPKDKVTVLDKSGTISLVQGTRLYNVASDALAPEIFVWSFRNQTDNYERLEAVTLEWLKQEYESTYDSKQGKPLYVYIEGSQLGLYPIPDAARTVDYEYPATPSRMTSTSATFPFPDGWLKWIEYYVRLEYGVPKGFGDPDWLSGKMRTAFSTIYAEITKARPSYIK